jgi:hypothetical protein
MIVLVSGATLYPRDASVGHLIVPKTWGLPSSVQLTPGQWAMDNGAFSGFDEGAFVRMLEAYHPYQAYQGSGSAGRGRGNGCDGSTPAGCLFVSAPDVVGDAAATLARWPFWSRLLRGLGYPPALVLQDGITPERVPWDEMGALFIGGTTAFKESAQVRGYMAYAKARGMWTHWGRVNGKRRYELALKAGCDSIDGTGFSMYPDTNIPLVAQWDREIQQQPELVL